MLSAKDKKKLKEFGSHVKAIRQSKEAKLLELHVTGELDSSVISKIERGEKNITLTTLLKLAHVLDVPPKKLLDIEGF
ncbi:helix-turn-helix domain-containing protein [Chitinophaga sp. XS-30]|uniref:helix-turn-helix domain-containing protein n=1 Tax=Chitinophaga sp. XS-30 TaxID=2604421 RepID=UPI0011DCD6DF|nr:helix-turn-helix transcriptional regulator [Chitinophaga sp. XS-30]QEH41415.1 helix-turn-helix transcriptional regulator [Chitinophaga sp. XS-30]